MENKELRFTFGVKIQPVNYVKGSKQYEPREFIVSGALSEEEAEEVANKWVKKWIIKTQKDINDKRTKEEKFSDSLDTTPKETLSEEEDKKASKVINNKK